MAEKTENTSMNTKTKLLFLAKYLMEHTDEQHPVSLDELITLCKNAGFTGNRNTIRNDITALQAAGLDVIIDHQGRFNAYFIGNRLFELAEVRTLIDAVSSSRFITLEKSEELIQKLTLLTSVHNRLHLSRSAFAADRLKIDSRGIFRAIDIINDAIRAGKKIRFQYIDYTPDKTEVLRHDGKMYVVSPHAFLWNDDRYYVPSYSEEKDCMIPFRVDRMRNVEIVDQPAVIDKNFNPSEYCRKVLKMYDGDVAEREVTLIADNKHMISVIDRFGEDVETAVVDDSHFRVTVSVCPSSTFYAWVFQFGGAIRIAAPDEIRAKYQELLIQAIENQKKLL